MKAVIAMALLVAGVCVSATSGSLLGGAEEQRAELKAQQAVTGSFLGALSSCDEAAEQPEGEPDAEAAVVEQTRLECRAGAIRGWDAELADSDLSDADLVSSHAAALATAEADVQRMNTAASETLEGLAVLAPGPRFMEWFGKGGIGWLAGLVLVVVGAVLGRQAAYARATAPTKGSSATPNFDDAVVTLLEATVRMQPLVAATKDGDDCAEARAIIEHLETAVLAPVVAVSYTHLTLPTNREV